MALPLTGTITLGDVRTELGGTGAISLRDASTGSYVTLNPNIIALFNQIPVHHINYRGYQWSFI